MLRILCSISSQISPLNSERRRKCNIKTDSDDLGDTHTKFYILGIEYKTPDSKSYEKKLYLFKREP